MRSNGALLHMTLTLRKFYTVKVILAKQVIDREFVHSPVINLKFCFGKCPNYYKSRKTSTIILTRARVILNDRDTKSAIRIIEKQIGMFSIFVCHFIVGFHN